MRTAALIILLLFNAAFGEERNGFTNPPTVPSGVTKTDRAVPVWGTTQNAITNPVGVPAANPFELSDFSGGLNLTAPSTELAENEALVCQNWLFNRQRGLQVRPGFGRVRSTVLSKQYPIYGLYHYALPASRGLLVGDSNYVWRMADDGTFAVGDTFLSYDTLVGTVAAGSKNINAVTFQGVAAGLTVGNFVLEPRFMRGDEVYFIGGANADQKRTIDVVSYDTNATTYRIILRSNVTSTQAGQKFIINARADSIPKTFPLVQRNNTLIGSQGGRRAFAFTGKLQYSPGIVNGGAVINPLPAGATTVDTSVSGNIITAVSQNELAGYFFESFSAAGGTGIRHLRLIKRQNQDSLFWGDIDTAVAGQGNPRIALQNYLIWSPVFVAVDSGIIDSVVNDSNRLKIIDRGKNFSDKYKYGNAVLEFLTGKLAGVQKTTMALRNNGDTLFVYKQSSSYLPGAGDRYAVYNIGLEARAMCLYYDRLVFVPPIFVNTIRYSEASDINDYPAVNFITLPEQGGDTIVALVPFNGNLVAMQKYRLWTLLGAPGWTGDDIVLASDGVGCIAPRSIVHDGNYIYFVGLRGNIPTVFRWDGGGVKFTTAGGQNIFEGEGHLIPLTTKIDPLLMKVNRSKFDKISAGLFGEHLLVSLPFGTSSVNDSTIAINTKTGAISLWTLAAGMWHNGRAAGDSGQVYFSAATDSGWVYLFGGATDSLDLGASFTTLYQTGWLDLGSPTVVKQGLRQWARHFRSSANGSSTWQTRTDFTTTNQNTFTTTTTTGERDENTYMSVATLGKRFGFRFEGSGVRGSFLLKGLEMKFTLRGEGL